MQEYQDRMIECVECKQEFAFEAGEQKFYAEHSYTTPKRCKMCREKKRQQKMQSNQEWK